MPLQDVTLITMRNTKVNSVSYINIIKLSRYLCINSVIPTGLFLAQWSFQTGSTHLGGQSLENQTTL